MAMPMVFRPEVGNKITKFICYLYCKSHTRLVALCCFSCCVSAVVVDVVNFPCFRDLPHVCALILFMAS